MTSLTFKGQRETVLRVSIQGKPPVFTDIPRTITFVAPGLDSIGFDRNGQYSTSYLMKYIVGLRVVGIIYPMDRDGSTLVGWETIGKAGLLFVSACQLDVGRVMYDRDTPKAPIKTRTSLVAMGTRSLLQAQECWLQETGQPLMKMTFNYAFVDRNTRKSAPFPESYLQQYGNRGTDPGASFRVERFQRPENTYCCWSRVRYLDTDFNKHTNYSVYMQYAINAIQEAIGDPTSHAETDGVPTSPVNSSKRCRIPVEVVQIGVKTARIRYFRESKENDMLQVHVWHHKGWEIRCAIENENGKDICQMSLEYHAPQSRM